MFRVISEGDVVWHRPEDSKVAGARLAVLPDGKIMCTFNEKTNTEANDCRVMACYSYDGESWSAPESVFPHFVGKKACFGSVRNTMDGRVCVGGFCFPQYDANQKWWSNEIKGMLENKLVAAISDDGYDFGNTIEIDLPFYASAENPGGAFVDKDGSIYVLYAPYRTIEDREEVKVNRLVAVKSTDGGKTFEPIVIGEQEPPCQYGESWIARISDDIHMVSTWQTSEKTNADKYFLSYDGANTFEGPYTMPFNGQALAIEPWRDGKVFVVYNLRSEEPAGVWLALAKPDKNGFNLIANECIWQAQRKTKGNSSGEFDTWTDFAFGEPHVIVLPDGNLLACLWYDSGDKKGIRYVKIAME